MVNKILEAKNKSKKLKRAKHDARFKPPGGLYKHPYTSFPHMKDYDTKVVFPPRDDNGKTKIGPKNILTKPAKRGHFNTTTGHLFNP